MKAPVWVTEKFILELHVELLAEFGGAEGIRDQGILDSALSRPKNLYAYQTPSAFELAASYAFGIIANHPFIDGNKRTGFMTAYVFLNLNGWQLVATQPDATAATLALAAKKMTESEYAAWLRDRCEGKN